MKLNLWHQMLFIWKQKLPNLFLFKFNFYTFRFSGRRPKIWPKSLATEAEGSKTSAFSWRPKPSVDPCWEAFRSTNVKYIWTQTESLRTKIFPVTAPKPDFSSLRPNISNYCHITEFTMWQKLQNKFCSFSIFNYFFWISILYEQDWKDFQS